MEHQPVVCQGLLTSETALRHITDGRTPLDEWSAQRIDLYLTAYNTHNTQTSMTTEGFEPTVLGSERPQAHATLGSAPTVYTDNLSFIVYIYIYIFTTKRVIQ